jgi:uncharacterized protein (TIGR00369 family)
MEKPMDKVWVNDDPENRCFGCSPHNERGLQLTFLQTGPRAIEARYEAPEHVCGAPGVIHGGIQAVLLDEAMGMAARVSAGPDGPWFVTAELELKYRKPAYVGKPLTVQGELIRVDGKDHFLEGRIIGPEGEILTTARSRWRQLRNNA